MKTSEFAKYSVILSIVPAVWISFFPGKIVLVTILCLYPLVFLLPFCLKRVKRIDMDGVTLVKLFYAFNVVIFLTGMLNAEVAGDWGSLLSGGVALGLFMPFAIYFGASNQFLVAAIRAFINCGLLLVAILFFTTEDPGPFGFAHQIAPLYLMILMLPYMSRKFIFFTAGLAIFSFISYMAIRSNVVNIIVATLIMLTYTMKDAKWVLPLLRKARLVVLLSPLIFSILGYSGYFNIFTIGEFFSGFDISDSRGTARDALVDSRTPIYNDVIKELAKKKALLFGLGGYGKTETSLTDISHADFNRIYIGGRSATESGMLNYFQWSGILGASIYFLIFVRASYLAMYKSQNWFCVMTGLWVAFKAAFSFIEDPLIFSPGCIFLFLTIGICLNKKLRSMKDDEVKYYLSEGLFGLNRRPYSILRALK
jgi:hypothetical protein